MCLRIGAALAFLCVLCATASAQTPAQTDSVVRVRKDGPVRVGKDPPAVVRELRPAGSAVAPRLLGTPVTPPLGTPLLQVFDTAQDTETRRLLLALAPDLPDSLQRELILRGVQLTGDRAATYVAGVSVLTALQLGEKGRAILRDALRAGIVRDERTLSMIEATLLAR